MSIQKRPPSPRRELSPRLFCLCLGLITGAALSFEILLMRLFSIAYGHHSASLIVSLALLGLGAGGVFLQLFQRRLMPRRDRSYPLLAFLFGLSVVGSFLLARLVPFSPREMTWSARPWLALAVQYLLYAVPFFLSGLFAATAMADERLLPERLYRADLLGAGLGAAAVMVLLYFLPAHRGLVLLALLGFAASALVTRSLPSRAPGWMPVALVAGAAALLLTPSAFWEPALSPYKQWAVLREIPGARVLAEKTTPAAHLQIVRVPGSPLRRAPGLTPECAFEPPEQLGLFADGELHGTLPLEEGGELPFGYLSCLPAAAAFLDTDRPKVFVKDAFVSPEYLLGALDRGSGAVVGSTLVPSLPQTVSAVVDEDTRDLYFGPSVRIEEGWARAVLAGSDQAFDVIAFWLAGSAGQAVGATAIVETFDLTVEGLRVFDAHLTEDGMLAVSMWRRRPPYEVLKFLATLRAAAGEAAAERIRVLATPSTLTVLSKKRPWTALETDRLRRFADVRTVDILTPSDRAAAQDGAGPDPLREDIRRILGPEAESFRQEYKFHLQPATDDRPFFHRFFRWRSLPELFRKRASGAAALLQWEYLSRMAALSLAGLLGASLLIVPVALRGVAGGRLPPGRRTLTYFGAIGLGFLFVEMTYIHLFTLFLGRPLLSAGLVVASFLVWAGIGSGAARRLRLGGVLIAVAVLLTLGAVGLAPLLERLLHLPLPARAALTVAFCGPPAFLMGMPLPKAIARLREVHPEGVPWSWGINGFASVISPLLAVLLAIHFGFTTVFILAALLYLTAWLQRPETP